jgi:hypothetical protein
MNIIHVLLWEVEKQLSKLRKGFTWESHGSYSTYIFLLNWNHIIYIKLFSEQCGHYHLLKLKILHVAVSIGRFTIVFFIQWSK